MFAIVTIGGKQYKVAVGDIVTAEEVAGKEGETMVFDKVLLVNDKEATRVGMPYVPKTTVTAKIVAQGKGDKIHVRRYKSKVRYRRRRGFRAHETTLQIVAIG